MITGAHGRGHRLALAMTDVWAELGWRRESDPHRGRRAHWARRCQNGGVLSRVALTGLRIWEMLDLRWRGLDLAIGTLTVRESVFEGNVQRPKTQRALRTIPLGPHAVQVLTNHRQRSARASPDDLVFPNRKGDPLRESKLLTHVLQPAGERAGLGRITWHQFRHVHSSLLNDLGVPVKIAQEQLGHASVQTTLNI